MINGTKAAWVSNGTIAKYAALFLSLDPSMGMEGGGVACVPLDLPGITRGKPLNKIGQRALNQGPLGIIRLGPSQIDPGFWPARPILGKVRQAPAFGRDQPRHACLQSPRLGRFRSLDGGEQHLAQKR